VDPCGTSDFTRYDDDDDNNNNHNNLETYIYVS
jgi:hypothetical protein